MGHHEVNGGDEDGNPINMAPLAASGSPSQRQSSM